ncbi:hypothetical protein [Cohnella silvisoli]|uniref:DUF2577 domain-containing protein n=1 Tax=Cohnella silvisoli TaxID=2873699 RepID=A0ABV1KM37_9BACL|nr:hypothetical protein [Cohnella silvisoli]MCD9020507.1 hypothetical protein [Cohnella silvisoli]
MPDSFKKLVTTLEGRLSGIAAKSISGLPSELGTITASGLKLDSFKYEIPDYLVAEWETKLHLPAFFLVGTMTTPVDMDGVPQGGAIPSQRTRFDFAEAEIEDVRLNWQAGMKPGDRVLAVPVNGGREVVVLCKVVSSGD